MAIRRENGSETRSVLNNDEKSLELIRNALKNLKFGQVTIYVQDGSVVMIERTEKQKVA